MKKAVRFWRRKSRRLTEPNFIGREAEADTERLQGENGGLDGRGWEPISGQKHELLKMSNEGPVHKGQVGPQVQRLWGRLLFPLMWVQCLVTPKECSEGYTMNIVFPNLEVGSRMLGRGQGHSKNDTGNDGASCFPLRSSCSQDTLPSLSAFPGSQALRGNGHAEMRELPLIFSFLCDKKEKRGGLLNFKLPDKLECGKGPFLGLHEGATSENGLLPCGGKKKN